MEFSVESFIMALLEQVLASVDFQPIPRRHEVRVKHFTATGLTYLLTPRCRVLLEKLTGLQLIKKFPAILWNLKVHYRTHKRPPPVPVLGQPTYPHPTSWRSILILSTHLRLGLPSGLFPSGFPSLYKTNEKENYV